VGNAKYRIDKGRLRTSPELRAICAREAKQLAAEIEARRAQYDAIIAAHPELGRLAEEMRELRNRADTAKCDAHRYQFTATVDRGIFRVVVGQGDTRAECEAKARANKAL
jgi:hypothetical protein